MEDQDLFSNLRIRASWGQLGNERMSANERSGLYSYLNSYNLGLVYQFSGNVVPAAAVTSDGKPDISWVITTLRYSGLDILFLYDIIELIAEFLWNYTR